MLHNGERLFKQILCLLLSLSILLPSAPANAYLTVATKVPQAESDTAATQQSDAKADKTSGDATETMAEDSASVASASTSGDSDLTEMTGDIAVQPDASVFTGAMVYNVPISVPPARAGITPKIALNYNSYRKQNGWVGIGWDLDFGSIQRSTRKGVNYSVNKYVFLLNGSSQELKRRPSWDASCSDGTAYGKLVDDSFSRFCKSTDGSWTVTMRDGTKSTYGSTEESQQKNADNTNTFRWFLTKTEDIDGNNLVISYVKETGQVYPTRLSYGANSRTGDAAPYYVKFVTGPRNDIPSSYISQTNVSTGRRLQTIAVKAGNGDLIRRYDLAYEYGINSKRSRLQSVTQYGEDGTTSLFVDSAGNPAPSHTFSWGQLDGAAEERVALTDCGFLPSFTYSGSRLSIVRFGDFNGDGLKDFAFLTGTGIWVGINEGGSFTVTQWMTRTPTYYEYFTVADMNRDGRDDIILDDNARSASGTFQVFLSTGSSFQAGPTSPRGNSYVLIPQTGKIMLLSVGDLNGDGYPEIFYFGPRTSTGASNIFVLPNTGQSLAAERSWGMTPANWAEAFFGDYDGDGCLDIFFVTLTNQNLRVIRSNGIDAFESNQFTNVFPPAAVSNMTQHKMFVADMNGDGLSDLGYLTTADPDTTNLTRLVANINAAISTGGAMVSGGTWPGWSATDTYFDGSALVDVTGDGAEDLVKTVNPLATNTMTPDKNLQPNSARANHFLPQSKWLNPAGLGFTPWMFFENYVDLNGNGLTDLFIEYALSNNTSRCFVAKNPQRISPDLLTGITNGFGASHSIAYKPYSKEAGVAHLPYVVHTVSSITTDAGNGITGTTSYTYSGGYHDYARREFRGFNQVTKSFPNGTTVISFNHQDYILAGLTYKEITRNSQNLKCKRIYRTFKVRDIADGAIYTAGSEPTGSAYFPYVESTVETSFNNAEEPLATQTDFEYDAYGNVTRKHSLGYTTVANDERDEVTSYAGTYDTTKWLLARPSAISSRGTDGATKSMTSFAYVPNSNRVLTKTHWLDMKTGAEQDPVIRYCYDDYAAGNQGCDPVETNAVGNLKKILDPKGQTSLRITSYDATKTYPTTIQNGLGHQVSRAYNRFGKVTQETDANNNTTRYDYDHFGRLTKTTNQIDYENSSPNGTVSTSYLDFGKTTQRIVTCQTKRSGANGGVLTKSVYIDGLGREIRTETDGSQGRTVITRTKYDNMGKVFKKSLPYFSTGSPVWTLYTYDPLGRPYNTTNPDGGVNKVRYDRNCATYHDPLGRMRKTMSNAYGQQEWVHDYSGTSGPYTLVATTHYVFDAMGRLEQIVDPKNLATVIGYDSLSRRRTMNHPDMGFWSYHYDPNGNLDSQTDARGQTISFAYDAVNRITQKAVSGVSIAEYAYDETGVPNGRGKLTSARVLENGVEQNRAAFAYDKAGRANSATYTIGGQSKTILTNYDSMGRIATITYPDQEVVSYTYDTGGNLSAIAGYATFPDYTALGQVRSIVFANGVTTDLQYWDTHQRLQLLQTTGPGGSLQNLSYDVYDLAGNISSIQDNNSSVRDQAFTYEPKPTNRLETAQTGAYGNVFMGYDTTDNFTSYTPVGPFTPAQGYSGRLLSAGPSPSGISFAFGYDSNGNMTGITKTDSQGQTVQQRTIAYDVENRPSAVDVNGVVTSFQYDFTGMRVEKTTGQSSTLYFGNLYECTDGGCVKHIFAGDRRIATKMSATEIYFYHPDHLGSTQVVTNASGAAVHTLFYEPYGDVCTDCETGSSPIRHKYTGQEEDSETGFYYYKSRYYDPVIGRFLSADPLQQAAFDPPTFPRLMTSDFLPKEPPLYALAGAENHKTSPSESFNAYAYCLNNPVKFIDPTGNWVWFAVGGFAAGFIIDAAAQWQFSAGPWDWRQSFASGVSGLAGFGLSSAVRWGVAGWNFSRGTSIALELAGNSTGSFAIGAGVKAALNFAQDKPLDQGVFNSGLWNAAAGSIGYGISALVNPAPAANLGPFWDNCSQAQRNLFNLPTYPSVSEIVYSTNALVATGNILGTIASNSSSELEGIFSSESYSALCAYSDSSFVSWALDW